MEKETNKKHPRLYAVRLTTLLYVVAEDKEEAMEIAEDNEHKSGDIRIESIAECHTLKDVELEWHYELPYTGDNINDMQSDYTVNDWISKIVKWRKEAKK